MKKVLNFFIAIFAMLFFMSCDNSGLGETNNLDENNETIVYSLRDRGPANGWIFYIDEEDEFPWTYLDVADENLPYGIWGTKDGSATPEGIAIGTGLQNTLEIIDNDPAPNKAADKCNNHEVEVAGVTYGDWFLPSLDEVQAIHDVLYTQGIGGISGVYWTSTQGLYPDTAIHFTFSHNQAGNNFKDNNVYMRPIRSF